MRLSLGVIVWRILLFLAAAISATTFAFDPKFPYSDSLLVQSGLPQWLWAWGNFDGVHYLTIAQRGYFAQFTQAFFPVYPLLLRTFSSLFFDKFMILSGLTVSLICLLISLRIFTRLLRLDYTNTQIKWTLLFLLFFPTSFYFGALYTEAFFFLLVVSTFYLVRQKKWLLASIMVAIASATRITGIFLWPALCYEWYIFAKSKKHSWRHMLVTPTLYIAPLGILLYMLYLHLNFGDALYFWHAQPVFGAERVSDGIVTPPQVVWRYLKIFLTVSPQEYHYWTAVIEASAFILGILGLVWAHRRGVRVSYLLFGWLVLLVPTLTGTFSSLPRYILLAFPVFIGLSLIKHSIIRQGFLVLSSILLLILTLFFIRGWWVA